LHVSEQTSEAFAAQVEQGHEGIKPGWYGCLAHHVIRPALRASAPLFRSAPGLVYSPLLPGPMCSASREPWLDPCCRARLNFPYFLDNATADYIIQAVALVAQHGWKLLHHYTFDLDQNLWTHVGGLEAPRQPSLRALSERLSRLTAEESCTPKGGAEPARAPSYEEVLADAHRLFALSEADLMNGKPTLSPQVPLPASCEKLRWFWLPTDCRLQLQSDQSTDEGFGSLGSLSG
jgi:hypothetical protein